MRVLVSGKIKMRNRNSSMTTIERVNEIKANTHKWINKKNAKARAKIKAKAKADLIIKKEGTWE